MIKKMMLREVKGTGPRSHPNSVSEPGFGLLKCLVLKPVLFQLGFPGAQAHDEASELGGQ